MAEAATLSRDVAISGVEDTALGHLVVDLAERFSELALTYEGMNPGLGFLTRRGLDRQFRAVRMTIDKVIASLLDERNERRGCN